MNDETLKLVKAASAGDSEAFSQLAENHGRVAASIAYGILYDKHLAADAVQEAFLKAYQKLEQLKDPEAFASWFLNIVRATSIDMLRRKKRWGSREVAMGDTETEGDTHGRSVPPSPPDALLQRENAVHIRAALGQLSAEYREVILLKHQEGRSYREIARLLKTSVRAVESRLFRARQQLHKLLQAHDVYVHGAHRKTDEIEDVSRESAEQETAAVSVAADRQESAPLESAPLESGSLESGSSKKGPKKSEKKSRIKRGQVKGRRKFGPLEVPNRLN